MNPELVEKVELHCHLDGMLCPSYVEVLQERGFFPDLDLAAMRRLYPVTSFEEWFRLGRFCDPLTSSQGEFLLEVMRLYLRDLAAQNVRYSEVMLSSFLLQFEDEERLEELLRRYRSVSREIPGLEVGLLWAVGRTPKKAVFEKKIDRIRRLWRKGLLDGLAIAGDEKAFRIKDFAGLFGDLAREGLPVEIHAGEWCGPESIWDALEYGHPRRLGHALCLFRDPVLVEAVRRQKIHLEFCPTSNLKVAELRSIREHPVFRAWEEGLSFSINTDDPGHFECTMNSEFSLLNEVRPFEQEAWRQVYRNSRAAAFKKPDASPVGARPRDA